MWSLFNHFISPKKFFFVSRRLIPWLSLLFVCTLSYGLIGGLYLAPADYLQGDTYRIIYVHVPCAFLSLFVYAIMGGAAFCSIVFQLKISALVIRESAPLGACFTFLALLTGSLWGKPMWGTFWIWDARLTSELILLFLYLGVILFQAAVRDKKSGNKAVAILVLVGAIDLPIIHYSVYWWSTLHQGATLKLFAPSAIDSSMLYPLLAMIVAALCYFAIVLSLRINYQLIRLFQNQHWLREKTS